MTPPPDQRIEDTLRRMVSDRAPRTICPSEVARALADDWRPLMPDVRRIAAQVPDVVATQKGQPVDPKSARGPIRLSLRQPD